MKTTLATLAAAAAALSAGPLAAESISVAYDDLNLADPSEMDLFEIRVERAARLVCGSSNRREVHSLSQAARLFDLQPLGESARVTSASSSSINETNPEVTVSDSGAVLVTCVGRALGAG